MKVQGIIPPVVTPMTPDEEVDYPRLRQVIDRQIAAGVHGIFVMDTP